MGDLIAGAGMQNGWSGAIILGPIRDSVVISSLDFGLKALGTNPMKSAKGRGRYRGRCGHVRWRHVHARPLGLL